jgi:hypothetical protein
MAQKMTIFRGTTGLNNKVDPVRLKFDPQTGIQDLAEAINIDIDLTGRPSRRKGYIQLRSDPAHSLWSNGDLCFYVSDGSLYRLNSDWSRTGLRSGLVPDARMSFCAIGPNVYYTNGVQNGRITEGASWPWEHGAYSGPETIWEVSTKPPLGHLLESVGGYMLVAEGNILWPSMQFAHSWYRLTRDRFEFDGKITMMKALADGVWVSDEKNTYWLEGLDPAKWTRNKKDSNSAIPGTAIEVDASLIGGVQQQLPDNCALWTTPQGICVGAAQGFFANLTQPKLGYPSAQHGASVMVDDKYLCAMDSHHISLALRLPANAATQYTNFNFNSACTFQGVPLAANDKGIFQLEKGGSDNGKPIPAWFKLVTSELGVENYKRVRRMYVGYEANGDLILTVIADEKIRGAYPLLPVDDDQTEQGNSVPGSRDVYGRYLAFKIENVNGADFSVDHLSILPVVLRRYK